MPHWYLNRARVCTASRAILIFRYETRTHIRRISTSSLGTTLCRICAVLPDLVPELLRYAHAADVLVQFILFLYSLPAAVQLPLDVQSAVLILVPNALSVSVHKLPHIPVRDAVLFSTSATVLVRYFFLPIPKLLLRYLDAILRIFVRRIPYAIVRLLQYLPRRLLSVHDGRLLRL